MEEEEEEEEEEEHLDDGIDGGECMVERKSRNVGGREGLEQSKKERKKERQGK